MLHNITHTGTLFDEFVTY